MELYTLWFILIAILYAGYFVLDGFDLGVGMLLPFLARDDARRRVMLNSVGPHWNANEVWLLLAGGATFAAFPNWYATLFSGFYFPLFLVLIGLILRGVAFELRSKDDNPRWRSFWDWAICIGSALPALLLGVAFANFVRGVPLDDKMNYVGGFWNLLNPYALLGGLVSLTGFLLVGASYLSLKTSGNLMEKAQSASKRLWILVLVLAVVFAGTSYVSTDMIANGITAIPTQILTLAALLGVGWVLSKKRYGWGFILIALAIILATATIFLMLYPRVLVSYPNPEFSLTVSNSSSGPNTLTTMTIVTIIMLPIVLAYQVWAYWIFRKKISGSTKEIEY